MIRNIRNKSIIDDNIKNNDYTYEIEWDPFPMVNKPLKKSNFIESKYE